MMAVSENSKISKLAVLALLVAASVAVFAVAPFVGATDVRLVARQAHNFDPLAAKVFWEMRLPRVLVGFAAGATLAICGMVFQALFRNPLVDASTLGVSAGASLGAAFYIWLGWSFSVVGISGISIFAFAGAILSILGVWYLSSFNQESSTTKLLLTGVVVSFFFLSLIMLIQYLSDISQSFRMSRWLMGSLYIFGYDKLRDVFIVTVGGLGVVWYFARELNLLMIDEEVAVSRGVDVDFLMKLLFVVTSFIIGVVVAVCGPIAFVGIIAPHICRLLIGSDHRYLTPATFLFGGLFLTVCDAFARKMVAPAEIPVGVITALLGGPFFLWLLRKR